ncbi:hypothetical protein FEF22_000155 [Texas Phoenix palm phytoplasma]|uniref:Integral membrane protein n=1 Tax=Texas Phoenix palm phytoplasma TaxID=176709 RepID=A0ABS5BI14_9MOLU|nr:hypothetical protein [Texas Phoenix palm phytoplasma]MBP3059204.1 hypothetical protein [Texas Phoenix palm phytoplasma]
MEKFLLKKISFVSFILAIAFIVEFVFTKLFFGFDCCVSFLKLELLPIVLIGFLFGFKISFFSILLYIFLHIMLEYTISFHQHGLFAHFEKENYVLLLGLLFFVFFIPYLSCSITGFFYKKNFNHLSKNNVIFKSLFLITIIQILSYMIFVYLTFFQQKNDFFDDYPNNIFGSSFLLQIDSYKMIFLYYFNSVIFTNLIIGIILYFIRPILKDNLENFNINIIK